MAVTPADSNFTGTKFPPFPKSSGKLLCFLSVLRLLLGQHRSSQGGTVCSEDPHWSEAINWDEQKPKPPNLHQLCSTDTAHRGF